MNLIKERSRAEIITFAVAVFGIWLSIGAVVLCSTALDTVAVLITLIALVVFAFQGSD